jgi:hypothetical protein
LFLRQAPLRKKRGLFCFSAAFPDGMMMPERGEDYLSDLTLPIVLTEARDFPNLTRISERDI